MAGPSLRERVIEAWPRVREWALQLTALATVAAGVIALVGAGSAYGGGTPSLVVPFVLAGIALVLASGLIAAGVRSDIVELILGGLAGGSFGVALAEMNAQVMSIPDHYKSLWIPAVLGALLVSFLAFRPRPG
jgi:hypothetical protein